MPLDFTSTKNFRDFVLGRTIKRPNGPQTFTASNYVIQGTGDSPNVDLGGVIPTNPNLSGNRILNLYNSVGVNYIQDLNVLRFNQVLNLYPYFLPSTHNLVGIMSNSNYDNESKLFQFAANNIRNNPQGPVLSRIARNTETAINGRARIIDALNGNTTTALNLLTGREPLIAPNYKITVSKTLPGKAIDFLETVAGVTTPFTQIPGDYLSNATPLGNEINYRPEAQTEIARIYQDVTGTLGSLIGIQRRPLQSRKPSDLLLEYTSTGQKQRLFEMIGFNTFGPNYTTNARSQSTSGLFNFVNNIGQNIRNLTGTEAPEKVGYLGDDRLNTIKNIMGDSQGRQVKSPYYLSLEFEKVETGTGTGKKNFVQIWNDPKFNKNITENGNIAGNFTWVRKNGERYANPIGQNNEGITNKDISETFSTEFEINQKSLLFKTQEILNDAAGNRDHVGNVIDQTSRFFKEDLKKISRGSAVRYVDKSTGDYSGIEYCRVWTKDNPYNNLQNTMKTTSNIRKYDGSVLGGKSRPWNLNIAPMSNGNKSFDNSTNIFSGSTFYGSNFYAKKYMFSIENLAWKTSNRSNYTVNDLPACERGSNGGRVMWFPPYDLKISEQNNANWDKNTFLGRPEPIYTYMDTERNGTVSFKVIVDHPSILNLLVRDFFKNMNDEEADNYINAFFAGCKDLDFYELVKTYTTLDKNDLDLIKQYLNSGTSKETIQKFKYTTEPVPTTNPQTKDKNVTNKKENKVDNKYLFYFDNDIPKKSGSDQFSLSEFETITNEYLNKKTTYIQNQYNSLVTLTGATGTSAFQDQKAIFNSSGNVLVSQITGGTLDISVYTGRTETAFNKFNTDFTKYTNDITQLKNDIISGYTKNVTIILRTTTSEVASKKYNFYLGIRRCHSIFLDILKKLNNNPNTTPTLKWFDKTLLESKWNTGLRLGDQGSEFIIPFKDLGYSNIEGNVVFGVETLGEEGDLNLSSLNENDPFLKKVNCGQKFNDTNLKIYAPQAFFCREGNLKIVYDKNVPEKIGEEPQTVTIPKIKVEPDSREITNIRPKPNIDVMKRIIMKVLSECYYFKKLEDDSPIIFNSLREKLKYFHPAFHSMTPEGLNSRLTFLNQCLRPGDTIPIKGKSDERDLNARNTAFGPPPVCVLRIGDFYHSKILIRDLNISYEDTTWDLNPEGIGVQPMIATVQLQVMFLGGHGLEKPVERLQNALSSNFYANTEMYDERSISTTTTIGGKKTEDFTKEFLEDLVKRAEVDLNANPTEPNAKIALGVYMGKLSGNTLEYTPLIEDFKNKMEKYFTCYKDTFNLCNKKYGSFMVPMLFHQNFRTITGCTVENITGKTTMSLFGEYPKRKEIGILIDNFRGIFLNRIDSYDIINLLNIDNCPPGKEDELSNEMKSYLKNISNIFFDSMISETSITSLIKGRTELISNLDKLNYIMEYSGDSQINGVTTTKATLSGFTKNDFYDSYKEQINWIIFYQPKYNDKLEPVTQSDYDNLSNLNFENTLRYVLSGKENDIVNITPIVNIYADSNVDGLAQLVEIIKSFTSTKKDTTLSLDKFPLRINTNKIIYDILSTAEVTDSTEKEIVRKIFRDKNELQNEKLNFYKP